ncbi:MFS transporter [Kribbella kalugense]|uniref:Putative MFS family arabinose efflux permease n=1 Tax=Kribbella kalugense TaxID=2512221 RepID=A0A4R8A4R5_9ACTN|nr:MFS transporter [Kribbella kalugense]TDW24478.1 putative MFS family arabinose efflux permease [Kribbella kalugense]
MQLDLEQRRRVGPMVSAAWIVTAVFALSNSPTPLYVRWQREIGFSAGTLTVIFATYILGLLLSLVVSGQLADRIGRKPVLIPGVAIAIVACLLFLNASSVGVLLLARLLTGIAVGVVVSAGMAAVVDLGGPERHRQASLIASVSMVLGAGLGPLLAGSLAQWTSAPIVPIFTVELVMLVVALAVACVLRIPRPQRRTSARKLEPLPRRHILFGVAVFAPGITGTSFVLSLGPSLLSKLLDVNSPLIAGGTACVMFLAATGCQFAVARLQVRSILLLGSLSTLLAMAVLMTAVQTATAALVVLAAVLAGVGQGLGQLGGLTLIGTHVSANRRAEANSLMNIGGYIPAGALPVATGYVINAIGLSAGATAFAVVLAVAAVLGGVVVRSVSRY